MADCNPPVGDFSPKEASLDVNSKYIELMKESLGSESIYTRAKDTLFRTFADLQITEKEKAELVLSYVTQFSTQIQSVAMQSALSWAKEERDGAYTLAKVAAEAEHTFAQTELVKAQICKTEKEMELACANITATSAGSIRDNGRVSTYGSDGCSVGSLLDEGSKYQQEQQIKADTYSRYADAYRKSGVVQVGTGSDGTDKGLSGDENGLTHQEEQNAERLRISYEDSKRNHAANSSASMIASMLSSEIAPNESDVQRWRTSIDFLNSSHSTTSSS